MKRKKLISIILAAIMTISVIAVIPAVADNSSDWVTLADWDGEQDVDGSMPVSFI